MEAWCSNYWDNYTMRLCLGLLLFTALCFPAVETLYFDQRTDYEGGKSFGTAGPYERIVAKATFTGGAMSTVDVLKPRDPAKGNGTLVLLMAPGVPMASLVEGGFTILQVIPPTRDASRDMVAFLKYLGSPFLLGDQKKFLKRAISIVPANVVSHMRQDVARAATSMIRSERSSTPC